MINPFERFYDTQIEIYEGGENTYETSGEKTFLGTLVCDIQPCGSDTESSEYGLCANKAYKLYSDSTELLKDGRYVLFGGSLYLIVRSEKGSFGDTALMRGVSYAD